MEGNIFWRRYGVVFWRIRVWGIVGLGILVNFSPQAVSRNLSTSLQALNPATVRLIIPLSETDNRISGFSMAE